MSQKTSGCEQPEDQTQQGTPRLIVSTPFGAFPVELPEGVSTQEEIEAQMPNIIAEVMGRIASGEQPVDVESLVGGEDEEEAHECACAARARAREEADRLFPRDPHLNAAVEALVIHSSTSDPELAVAALVEAKERIEHRLAAGPVD